MNNVTDSGFDFNGMTKNINSHKNVTLADVSVTENSFDDLFNSSSKNEKQRQNKEFVILESSSLSGFTGSRKSVLPPKMAEKELCEMFINIERQNSVEPAFESRAKPTNKNTNLAQSLYYFIDAASLADEEETYREQDESFPLNEIPRSSRSVPFETMQSSIGYLERNVQEQSDDDSIQKMSLASESLKTLYHELWLTMEQSSEKDDTPATIKKNEFTSCVVSPVVRNFFTHSSPYDSNIFHGHDTLEYSPIQFSEEDKTEISPKTSYQASTWVVDMSEMPKTDTSVYSKKKNIFPMFIDLGENSTDVKEMPARLSSSLHSKKNCKSVKPTTSKTVKSNKKCPGPLIEDKKIETLCNTSQMGISKVRQRSIEKIDKELREVKTKTAPIIREEPDTDQYCDTFVRLSDLDKAPQKNDIVAIAPSTECFERMAPSIPDNNGGETSHTSTNSIEIISSFHSGNVIPDTTCDINRSMPGSARTMSRLSLGVTSHYEERDELASDVSEMRSVQRSMYHFVVGNCQSRLEKDLLRMFMEEKDPDVIVEVSGRQIKAHKCILSLRCQYFAGILSGRWVNSDGYVVSLPQFSYSVVYFALCHIYTGISTIPDSISIVELATLANMLNLDELKKAIFTLTANHCNHFHEPCQVPTTGELERLPLSSVYQDELYRCCLRRIMRYFRKVRPTKASGTPSSEICIQEHLLKLITNNFSNTVHDCGLTEESLERCRWEEVVPWLCRRLVDEAVQLASKQLLGLMYTITVPPNVAANALDANALVACRASGVEWAVLDKLCRALSLLHALQKRPMPGQPPNLLALLRRRYEAALHRWTRALSSSAFRNLPPDLLAALHRRCEAVQRRWPCAFSSSSSSSSTSRSHHVDVVPPTMSPTTHLSHRPTLLLDAHCQLPSQSAAPNAAHSPRSQPASALSLWVRTTKAQEQRAKFNNIKSTSTMSALPEAVNSKQAPPTAVNRKPTKGNANSRHQEPQPPAAGNEADAAASRPLSPPSKSSRNFSPVLAHVANTPRKPSAEHSTESLNANQFATCTKARKDIVAPSTPASRCNGTSSHFTESLYANQFATCTKARKDTVAPSTPASRCNGTSSHSTESLNANQFATCTKARKDTVAPSTPASRCNGTSSHSTESLNANQFATCTKARKDTVAPSTPASRCNGTSSHSTESLNANQFATCTKARKDTVAPSTPASRCNGTSSHSTESLNANQFATCTKARKDTVAPSTPASRCNGTSSHSTESLNANQFATCTKARKDTVAPSTQAVRCNGTSSQTNVKRASKIPVYSKLNVLWKGALASEAALPAPGPSKPSSSAPGPSKPSSSAPGPSKPSSSAPVRPGGSFSAQVRHPGSPKMATKSRSAKIVPKIVPKTVKDTSQANHSRAGRRPPLERSGTFLKEEPTFGDRTTKIDE